MIDLSIDKYKISIVMNPRTLLRSRKKRKLKENIKMVHFTIRHFVTSRQDITSLIKYNKVIKHYI